MKKSNILTFLTLILVTALSISSCSKKLTSSSSDAGNLEYRFTGNESYSYMQSSKANQTIVFGGQEVNTSINSILGFTTRGKGIVNGSLILEITVDTLGVSINSMGTNMKEDISNLKGKSFMMTMDPKGDNKDLDEAESMTFTVAGVQTSNLKSSFVMLFPKLPKENIKIGYIWQQTDTININTETENAEMIIVSNNTIESRETVSGYDCYKISYVASGTRDGSSQTPQGLIITNTDVSGTGYLYFAIKEGIVVSDHSDIKTDGDLVIPSGESIPMYITATSELKLL